jgi:signal transduction histidine kinase
VPHALAATVVTAAMVLVSSHLARSGDGPEVGRAGVALIVIAGASLALCRRWPRSAFAVAAVVVGVYVGLDRPYGPILAAGWLALFMLSWRTDRRSAVIAACPLCGVLGVATVAADGVSSPAPLVFVGWSAVAALAGDAVRNRRRALDEMTERARHLERTRDEEARRRVAEDRLRIARDLHDSVAHAMATINVHAGAAVHVVDRRPAAAKEALAAIQRASGEVLDELAAMLALLRADGEPDDRRPTPGIEQLGDLAMGSRDARLSVSLDVEGPSAIVPRPVGIAAYRIVQESLTNVIRHSSATSAAVTVRIGADRSVDLEVRDDGAGDRRGHAPGNGTGVGIRGMRERAEATGGRLEVASPPGGGFVVRAAWAGET